MVDEDILKKVQYIRQRPRPGVKVEGEGGRLKPQSIVQNICFVGSPGSYFVNKLNKYSIDWPYKGQRGKDM